MSSRKRSVLANLWTSCGETPTIRQSRRRLAGGVTDLGEGWKIWDEEFVTGVLHVTAQPLWVVDPEGLIRFANPAAIEALGYDSAEELLGRHSHETIHYQHPDGSPYPASDCPMLLPPKNR